MEIRFKKLENHGAALTCTRKDGSSTWQRPKRTQAAFFALHDLTHVAVESELMELTGFFQLVAAGWDIQDFENVQNRPDGQLPENALLVELIVGLLDSERASQATWTAEQFNSQIQTHFQDAGTEITFSITDEQLKRIRLERNQLISRFTELSIGESMTLIYQN